MDLAHEGRVGVEEGAEARRQRGPVEGAVVVVAVAVAGGVGVVEFEEVAEVVVAPSSKAMRKRSLTSESCTMKVTVWCKATKKHSNTGR